MSWEMMASLVPSALAVLAVYVRLTNEMGKLKTRMNYMEGDRDEMKKMLQHVSDMVQEIKLILAKNQL
tara:strand:- start:45 stop:248 length:204 start_codon:yes stop_codon:yes gene_type:complete